MHEERQHRAGAAGQDPVCDGLDLTDLPLWALYVSAAAASMESWGLPRATLAVMQDRTAAFQAEATQRVLTCSR